MNQSEIEMYHDSGKMSDKFYYQQNGKSAQENYNEQRRKFRTAAAAAAADPVSIDKEQAEKDLKEQVENVLDDLLKGLNLN